MTRIAVILILALGIFSSGCWTPRPEVWAMWQKYRTVKPGMTRSQVEALFRPVPTFRTPDGLEVETWFFGTIEKDGVILTVVYDAAGRVQKVYRDRW